MDWSFDDLGGWKPVSRFGGLVCISLYALFLLYAFRDSSGFLFLDFVNLIIHEAGHPLFSWFGNTLMLLGGTLLELIVPAACAVYFYFQRHTHGFVFSSFWFFENFLYIGTYMEDARANALPLVNSEIGDWTILFGQWGLLDYDLRIGHSVRAMGWLGMLASVAWLAYRMFRATQPQLKPLEMQPQHVSKAFRSERSPEKM